MRRFATLMALGVAGLMMGVTATPAQAATGQVVVFSTEVTPLKTYENPEGCYSFPLFAHVLNNQTDATVMIHPDPFCGAPGMVVLPGFGMHVPEGYGSFSV
ncbi:hypothetical protein [Streptomyces odontomachi]|uniref:hypothetical protein n=1 Tax=Streptomyces odontomachi TaxID=2944940 RepID=UPI002108F798|nr:hypothetical protein [Streptomyces sp. ODS25]